MTQTNGTSIHADALRARPSSSGPIRIFTEARLYDDGSGSVVALDRASSSGAWTSYVAHLEAVQLAARVGPPNPRAHLPIGEISVYRLPFYQGPRQLISRLPQVIKAVARSTAEARLCVFVLPGPLGSIGAAWCRLRRRRYAVEVIGDPVQVLRSGVMGPIGIHLAPACGRLMTWLVGGAGAAHYVTEETLQRLYPPAREAHQHAFSNVDLRDADFSPGPRQTSFPVRELIAVGTQDQLYKGHDDLIRAVAMLSATQPELRLTLVGDGRHSAELRALAVASGIADRVTFEGRVDSREELRRLLDRAALFCMPSRTEGLPRALIEAMARGVPCIGTSVGGIPELLPTDLCVPPDNPVALAAAIAEFAEGTRDVTKVSRTLWERAQRFRPAQQARRREQWLASVTRLAGLSVPR